MHKFLPREPSDVGKLIEAYPLCWIVSDGAEQRFATPLPLLPELGPEGQVVSLFGHIALSNPQQKALENNPKATILSMGPQGYISPELVSNPTWGPTWNYAVCRFECDLRFAPEETETAVFKLAAALEGTTESAWTPARMGERYHELKKHIIAFRARVLETHARFKLGQDENDLVFSNIVDGLENRELADWMTRSRP
jgi:transcriptional regulator